MYLIIMTERLTDEEVNKLMGERPELAKQAYDQILGAGPTSPYVIGRQATINIGTIGHVAHGKTTVVKAISGVNTIKFSDEMKNNITIKLGYANTKIYRCPKCPEPVCYKSFGSEMSDTVQCDNAECGSTLDLIRHISFVDCPGHDNLMAIMLTGAAVMDAALLLVAGNMTCPQPQTSEHLAAVDIMQLNKIIILQNKIDLVFSIEGEAEKNHQEIMRFIQGTKAQNSPIVPISAQFRYNIDVVLQYLVNYIPIPIRDLTSSPRFMVVRSFDVNKPGFTMDQLRGGIAGGSVLRGVLKVGDEIEIRPGRITKNTETGVVTCTPITSVIKTMNAEKNDLLYAIPGGLIGIGLTIDPFLTKRDALVGNLIGYKGELPDIYYQLDIEYKLMIRLIGVKLDSHNQADQVRSIATNETLMINVGTTSTGSTVLKINSEKQVIRVELTKSVCTTIGDQVAISRRISNKFRLIGWGKITGGKKHEMAN